MDVTISEMARQLARLGRGKKKTMTPRAIAARQRNSKLGVAARAVKRHQHANTQSQHAANTQEKV